MTGTSPEQEPSIEEILASIRQIISDDDEGAPAASVEPDPVPRSVAPAPPPPPPRAAPKEDVLELKDPLPESKPVIVMAEPEDEPEPRPVFTRDDTSDDGILTDAARSAALSGFSRLAQTVPVERGNTPRMSEGTTLEDIVRDMLQPMLREWLDENLPPLIERLVQKELDKLARKAMDD